MKNSNKQTPKILMKDGTHLSNPKDIAEEFNTYFTKVGPDLAGKIKNSKKPYHFYINNRIRNSFYINPTNSSEIRKLILNLSNKKSSGPNSLPVSILKNCVDIICEPLSKLINISFYQGKFPSLLKKC